MAVFSAIAAGIAALGSAAGTIGTAVSIAGTAAGVAGQFQQAAGQRKVENAQKRAEVLRQKQMELDTMRKTRETVRQQQIARANALSTTTNQGANGDGSSALGGAEGTIMGQGGRNIQELNSNLAYGEQMFGVNQDVSEGKAMAAQGGTISGFGSGLTSLGNALVNNQKTIRNIGGTV